MDDMSGEFAGHGKNGTFSASIFCHLLGTVETGIHP
jgi:hypothetical protein